jgi:hypothetical protein
MMDEMTQSRVPMPTLLNPDRQVVNSRADFLDHDRRNLIPALERSIADLCAYGQQLWNDVNAMRTYLLHHQPPTHRAGQPARQLQGDPVSAGQSTTTTTGDAGGAADDADGQAAWRAWIAAYAAVTSVLAGPHGDSGFGIQEAHRIAEMRLTTP